MKLCLSANIRRDSAGCIHNQRSLVAPGSLVDLMVTCRRRID